MLRERLTEPRPLDLMVKRDELRVLLYLEEKRRIAGELAALKGRSDAAAYDEALHLLDQLIALAKAEAEFESRKQGLELEEKQLDFWEKQVEACTIKAPQ